jgi:ankyrin repeat protein
VISSIFIKLCGITALLYSTLQSNREIIQLLLSQKANPSIRASNGKTAYDIATRESIKALLQEK